MRAARARARPACVSSKLARPAAKVEGAFKRVKQVAGESKKRLDRAQAEHDKQGEELGQRSARLLRRVEKDAAARKREAADAEAASKAKFATFQKACEAELRKVDEGGRVVFDPATMQAIVKPVYVAMAGVIKKLDAC